MIKKYKCDICKDRLAGRDVYRFTTTWNECIRVCGNCVREYGGKKEVKEAYEIGDVILVK